MTVTLASATSNVAPPYTVAELAVILRLHPRTVTRLAREGKLPAVLIGSRYMFPRRRIQALIDGEPS